jgi:hypothetical protein
MLTPADLTWRRLSVVFLRTILTRVESPGERVSKGEERVTAISLPQVIPASGDQGEKLPQSGVHWYLA